MSDEISNGPESAAFRVVCKDGNIHREAIAPVKRYSFSQQDPPTRARAIAQKLLEEADRDYGGCSPHRLDPLYSRPTDGELQAALEGEVALDVCARRWRVDGGVLGCTQPMEHDGACAGDWLVTDWGKPFTAQQEAK